MVDTERNRDEQAREEDRRRGRALDRADDAEPPHDEQAESDGTQRGADKHSNSLPECHRRGCDEPATFVVLERYQEDTGHGAVEAEASLCREHTAEESPSNLDGVYADYVFRVEPLPGTVTADTE